MKYLITYEAFAKNDYKEGDIVKVIYDGKEYIAKISKINTKFSYNVLLKEFGKFINPPVEIKSKDIIEILKPAEEPVMGKNWVTIQQQKPSNDIVLNNFPESIPLANPMPW